MAAGGAVSHSGLLPARLPPPPPAEKVLSRGEKLDMLVDKTDNLMFEVGGGGMKLCSHMYCWRGVLHARGASARATCIIPV